MANNESKKKTRVSKKRNNSSDYKENRPKRQKKADIKPDPNDSIEISRLLLKEKSSRIQESRTCKRRNNEKPKKEKPSLADLEKMYEDSDSDNGSNAQNLSKASEPKASETSNASKTQTPENVNEINSDAKLFSPTTIYNISERMLDMISNVSDPSELLDGPPPPPVIPQKKAKKGEIPYMVGCKDREQVESRPSTNFCIGDNYGIESSTEGQDDFPPNKRAKRSNIPAYTTSIFNSKSDEIVKMLQKEDDSGAVSDASTDSNKTVDYDINTMPLKYGPSNSFSPLPSTSRDNVTFIKNDEMFSESLKTSYVSYVTPKEENDVQIIDIPCETIVIDDTIEAENPVRRNSNPSEEIGENRIEILEPTEPGYSTATVKSEDDDCVIIQNPTKPQPLNEPIVIDDEYADIENILTNDIPNANTDEIIDVDELIAQNQSIIERWNHNSKTYFGSERDTVVDVPNSTSTPRKAIKVEQEQVTSVNPGAQTSSARNNNLVPSVTNNTERNEIEKVVTDFFKNRQNNRNSEDVMEVNSADEARLRAVVSTTLDTKFNKKDLQSVQCFLNEIIENFTPRNILNEFSPHRKRRQDLNSDSVVIINDEEPYQANGMVPITINDNSQNMQRIDTDHFACITTTVDVTRFPLDTAKKQKEASATHAPGSPKKSNTRNLGDCPICLDALSTKAIASTICGHVFCLKCIQAAIKVNGKKCPTCRKVLKGAAGYHQLYL